MREDHPSPIDERELLRLVSLLHDGGLSEPERKLLESWLTQDENARRIYLQASDQHQELARLVSVPERSGVPQVLPRKGRTSLPGARRRKVFAFVGGVVAASIVAGFFLRGLVSHFPIGRETQRETVAAVVVRQVEAKWDYGTASPIEGQEIGYETIRLARGLLRIDLADGAWVTLRGPSTFQMLGTNQMRLVEGEVAAGCFGGGVGFQVETDALTVTDFGTQFSVNRIRGEQTEVFVREGKVSLSSPDGRQQTVALAGETFLIQDRSLELETADFPVSRFLSALPREKRTLEITDAYREKVLAANPVGYWRFENVRDGDCPNEVVDGLPATALGPYELVGAKRNRSLFLDGKAGPVGFEVEEVLPAGATDKGYTIELWASPYAHKPITLAVLYSPVRKPWGAVSSDRAAMIQLLQHQGVLPKLRHRDYGFWFRHQHSDGPGAAVAQVFSKSYYRTDIWQHFVAVRRGGTVELYLNGELDAIEKVDRTDEWRSPLSLLIGKTGPKGDNLAESHGLAGRIDEVALYAYPLDASEIRSHFQLVDPPR